MSHYKTATKTILAIATALAIYSCSGPREVQVEMVSAKLIKIDTVFRSTGHPQEVLTWRDDNQIDYVTYAALNNGILLGSKMIVLVKR